MENEIINQDDEQLLNQTTIQIHEIQEERKSRLDCCCNWLARSIISIMICSGFLLFIGAVIYIDLMKRQS